MAGPILSHVSIAQRCDDMRSKKSEHNTKKQCFCAETFVAKEFGHVAWTLSWFGHGCTGQWVDWRDIMVWAWMHWPMGGLARYHGLGMDAPAYGWIGTLSWFGHGCTGLWVDWHVIVVWAWMHWPMGGLARYRGLGMDILAYGWLGTLSWFGHGCTGLWVAWHAIMVYGWIGTLSWFGHGCTGLWVAWHAVMVWAWMHWPMGGLACCRGLGMDALAYGWIGTLSWFGHGCPGQWMADLSDRESGANEGDGAYLSSPCQNRLCGVQRSQELSVLAATIEQLVRDEADLLLNAARCTPGDPKP